MDTKKQTKQYIILGVLLITMGGVLYFGIFRKSSQQASQDFIEAVPPAGMTATSRPFLPNGTKLDFQVLNNPKIEEMSKPSYPVVKASELGLENPFNKQ